MAHHHFKPRLIPPREATRTRRRRSNPAWDMGLAVVAVAAIVLELLILRRR